MQKSLHSDQNYVNGLSRQPYRGWWMSGNSLWINILLILNLKYVIFLEFFDYITITHSYCNIVLL